MIKATVIRNGVIKLVLTANDPIDKLILEELAKGEVEITTPDRIQLLDSNLSDSVVITNKVKKDE